MNNLEREPVPVQSVAGSRGFDSGGDEPRLTEVMPRIMIGMLADSRWTFAFIRYGMG